MSTNPLPIQYPGGSLTQHKPQQFPINNSSPYQQQQQPFFQQQQQQQQQQQPQQLQLPQSQTSFPSQTQQPYQQQFNNGMNYQNQGFQQQQQQQQINPAYPQQSQFNRQQSNNQQQPFPAMRQNSSSGMQFLDENFSGLGNQNFEATDMVKNLLEEAETSCEIFKQRQSQINNDIKVLEESKILKSNFNRETAQAIEGQSKQFSQFLNEVEDDFIDNVIDIRIVNTECIGKYRQLAQDFQNNNCNLIKQIVEKYRQIGIQNLQAEEYLQWLEIIKQSQMKLNVLMLYSEMIQKTLRIIQERHRDAQPNEISKSIEQYENDLIDRINDFR